MMKKILLASDGSSYADDAAWLLAHLPHQQPVELFVVTVVDLPGDEPKLTFTRVDRTVPRRGT